MLPVITYCTFKNKILGSEVIGRSFIQEWEGCWDEISQLGENDKIYYQWQADKWEQFSSQHFQEWIFDKK